MSIRRGIRIGVDVGTVRVGVSRCDPDGILTMPVETLHRVPDLSDLDRLADIAQGGGTKPEGIAAGLAAIRSQIESL